MLPSSGRPGSTVRRREFSPGPGAASPSSSRCRGNRAGRAGPRRASGPAAARRPRPRPHRAGSSRRARGAAAGRARSRPAGRSWVSTWICISDEISEPRWLRTGLCEAGGCCGGTRCRARAPARGAPRRPRALQAPPWSRAASVGDGAAQVARGRLDDQAELDQAEGASSCCPDESSHASTSGSSRCSIRMRPMCPGCAGPRRAGPCWPAP